VRTLAYRPLGVRGCSGRAEMLMNEAWTN
jgi:hypothetical protein